MKTIKIFLIGTPVVVFLIVILLNLNIRVYSTDLLAFAIATILVLLYVFLWINYHENMKMTGSIMNVTKSADNEM